MPDPTNGLPRRPVLPDQAPVLRRTGGRVQVGLEPNAVVVAAGAAALLPRLDGSAGLDALREGAHAYGLSATDVEVVLHALHTAGLLCDAGPPSAATTATGGGRAGTIPGSSSPPSRASSTTRSIRLIGLGRLGQQVASLLVGAGLHVYAAADHRRTSPRPPVAAVAESARARPGTGRLTMVNHWSKPDTPDAAATVVALDTVEPDRVITEWLLRADQAHLVLRCAARAATVGPFVLPGQSACLRCTDLRRREADPDWPVLLPQLEVLRPPASDLLVAWAAAVGAAQVLVRMHGGMPETAGASVELDEVDHLTRWRRWPLHAACGCAWAATTEWGA